MRAKLGQISVHFNKQVYRRAEAMFAGWALYLVTTINFLVERRLANRSRITAKFLNRHYSLFFLMVTIT